VKPHIDKVGTSALSPETTPGDDSLPTGHPVNCTPSLPPMTSSGNIPSNSTKEPEPGNNTAPPITRTSSNSIGKASTSNTQW
jgi:hypothetical protein